jgi:malonyl-CoA decarboxylase
MQNYLALNSTSEQIKAENSLRDALTSSRLKILRDFSALPNGVKFLVDLRADLLPLARQHQACQGMDNELRGLLASWFDVNMLDMVQIDWQAPAALLEKLIDYEAVHAITSWNDLKNRLDSDRRCFAFFHYKMPDEPLIFVEVALENTMADSIQTLLDVDKPTLDTEEANTAVFYSISNAQAGLAGISFGNFLIKRVVDKLQRECPSLKYFCTLSPIPGFARWLEEYIKEHGESTFAKDESQSLCQITGAKQPVEAFRQLTSATDWWKAPQDTAVDALRIPLMRLCAIYLTKEQGKRGGAKDPVAHFHLTNGARIERLNWLADTSEKGLKQSYGMMVNYYYKLSAIDENHEQYVSNDARSTNKSVRAWLDAT